MVVTHDASNQHLCSATKLEQTQLQSPASVQHSKISRAIYPFESKFFIVGTHVDKHHPVRTETLAGKNQQQILSPPQLLESPEQSEAFTHLYPKLSLVIPFYPGIHQQTMATHQELIITTNKPVSQFGGSSGTRSTDDELDLFKTSQRWTIYSKDSGYDTVVDQSTDNTCASPLSSIHPYTPPRHRSSIKHQDEGEAHTIKQRVLSPPRPSRRQSRSKPHSCILRNQSRIKVLFWANAERSKYTRKSRSTHTLLLDNARHVLCTPNMSTTHPNYQVSFSTLVLTRASKEVPANLQMTAIRDHQASRPGEVGVEQGEYLTALYQRKGAMYVITKSGESGFIPSNVCFLSSKYQKDQSKASIFNKRHALANIPEGGMDKATIGNIQSSTFGSSVTTDQPIQAISFQQHRARYSTELSVHRGEFISVLFHDEQWVYGVTGRRQAGFVPSCYCHLNFF